MPTAPGQMKRVAILCVVAFLAANAAFYFLSDSYFESHREIVGGASVPSYSPAQVAHLRTLFAVVSGVIAAVSLGTGVAPRVIGHVLPAALGLFSLVGGAYAVLRGGSGALAATLLVAGGAMPVLAWFSYHRSRAAWAFLAAICSVLAVASLFGAPKLRGVLDVSLWTTMLIPGLFAVAAVTLHLLRDDYVDQSPVPAA